MIPALHGHFATVDVGTGDTACLVMSGQSFTYLATLFVSFFPIHAWVWYIYILILFQNKHLKKIWMTAFFNEDAAQAQVAALYPSTYPLLVTVDFFKWT